MSIPSYLANIKSAGVYRYVFDKSMIPATVDRTSLRLLVGYSEKGPFNTPVFISNASEFINTFGNISRRMERKGIFFHRLALQALQAGPILALNIKPFNVNTTNPETASVIGFNASDIKYDAANKSNNIHGTFKAQIAATNKGSRDAVLTSIYDTNRFWKVDADRLHDIKMGAATAAQGKEDYVRMAMTSAFEDSCTIFIRPCIPSGYDVKISDWYSAETADEMPPYMESIKDHYLSEFFAEVYVFKGDLCKEELFAHTGTLGSNLPVQFIYETNADGTPAYWETSGQPKLKTIRAYDENGTLKDYTPAAWETYAHKDLSKCVSPNEPSIDDENYLSWQPFCVIEGTGANKKVYSNPDYRDAYGQKADALLAMADVTTSNYISSYVGCLFPDFRDANGRYISLDIVFNADYNHHKMLMKFNPVLLDEASDFDQNADYQYNNGETTPTEHGTTITAATVAGYVHALTSAVHITNGSGLKYGDYSNNNADPAGAKVQGIYMEGYTYNSILKADRGRSLVDKIYGVLQYKGIFEALTNNVDVDYHYLVDTFQGYPGFAMKSQWAQIAKKKMNALAILNFPPMEEIMTHCGVSKYSGGFDMAEVAKTINGISLPAETQGASWAAFYTQLVIGDGGAKATIPSAALVSNLFMEKCSKRLPYYIVAGPKYGRISDPTVIGPDYNYAQADLDILEPMGVNAIVHIPRHGIVINSNQTAKQTPVSALSKVHVRELVTFIQDEIENMLRGYQWDLNTADLRGKVAAKAETILGLVLANGGIYDYRVKCDEDNNTPETIDNEMLIVDLEIEPARGAGKMIQTLTLHRTGGIAAMAVN